MRAFCRTLPVDSGLNHVSCFGQGHAGKHKASRGLHWECTPGFVRSCTSAVTMTTCLGWSAEGGRTCGADPNCPRGPPARGVSHEQQSRLADHPRCLNGHCHCSTHLRLGGWQLSQPLTSYTGAGLWFAVVPDMNTLVAGSWVDPGTRANAAGAVSGDSEGSEKCY